MADLININMSAAQVIGNLQSWAEDNGLEPNPALSPNMDAEDFVTSINGMLSAGVLASDSATEAIEKINAAVDGYVTDDTPLVLKFLHISDTHGTTDSVLEAEQQMNAEDNGISALIHTGDISPSVITAIADRKEVLKPLSVIGNHDAKDSYQKNVVSMRTAMERINDGVTWGNMEPKTEGGTDYYGCYWYKDYWVNEEQTRRLRIIGLDQYNYTEKDPDGGSTYTNCISQEQVDWFIGLITSLDKNDYFIVCMHDVPWNCSPSYRRKNDWCSSRLWASNGSYIPTTFFASVINAFIHGINTSLNKITGRTYAKDPERAEVSIDFSQYKTRATFLCYFCGHEHGDYHDYHPISSFKDQLILCVDTAQRSAGGNNSDIRTEDVQPGSRGSGNYYLRNCLSNTGNGILMNLITLNFASKTITVSRIGQYKAAEHDTSKGFYGDSGDPNGQSYIYPAVERTTITFPFKRNLI